MLWKTFAIIFTCCPLFTSSFFWPLLFYSNTFSIVYSTCPRAFEFTSWLLLFKLIANKRASTVYNRQAESWPRACLSSLHRHQPQSQPLPLIPTHAMQKFNWSYNGNYLYLPVFCNQTAEATKEKFKFPTNGYRNHLIWNNCRLIGIRWWHTKYFEVDFVN